MSFSSIAWAACNSNGTQTNAISVQSQSGQGNWACTDVSGQGGTMQTLTSGVNVSGTTVAGSNGIDWSTTNPTVDVDLIRVEDASGKGCNYFYDQSFPFGTNLTPDSNQSIKTVTFCTDNLLVEVTEPPPQPIATATTCDGTIAEDFQTAVNANPSLRHVIAVGEDPFDGSDNLALCSSDDNGNPSQEQCANRCIRPDGFPNHIPPGTDCTPSVDGKIDLDCRVCELASVVPNDLGVPYCWEFSHQVNELLGTFKPPTVTTPGWVKWEKIEGSACFLFTTTFFGVEYSYWTPSGCPK